MRFILLVIIILSLNNCNEKPKDLKYYTEFLQDADSIFVDFVGFSGINENIFDYAKDLYFSDINFDKILINNSNKKIDTTIVESHKRNYYLYHGRNWGYHGSIEALITAESDSNDFHIFLPKFIITKEGENFYHFIPDQYKDKMNRTHLIIEKDSLVFMEYDNHKKMHTLSLSLPNDLTTEVNSKYKNFKKWKIESLQLGKIVFLNCLRLDLYEIIDNFNISFWIDSKIGVIQFTIISDNGYSIAFKNKKSLKQ